nr:SGNH/GDSL hydrolase family protein [Rhizobium sp. Q54]
MALTAAEVYRDFVTDGVPSSEWHQPKKSEIRALLGQYEQIINAFTSNGGLIYATKAAMDADLAKPANTMAWVIEGANSGIYRKLGGAGTGSWVKAADLPFSFIPAEDTGDGTPNAIQATSALPISSSALVLLNVYETNTGSPATVSFNGGSPLTIKTNSGNDVSPGGLQSGMLVVGRVSGSIFRLVSDQVAAAIIAQAEALVQEASEEADRSAGEANRSELARDLAQQYASDAAAQAEVPLYTSVLTAAASTIPVGVTYLRTAGYAVAGDGGGALYKRAVSEPGHSGKFQSSDGAWWGLGDQIFNIRMFGALPSVADNRQALQNALDFAGAVSHQMHIPAGVYPYTVDTETRVVSSSVIALTGDGRESSILLCTISGLNGGDTTTVDGLQIFLNGLDYGNFNGHIYRDFAVNPVVGGQGRNAIRFILEASAFFANFLVDGVKGGDFGKQGIHFDNSINNLDGFFVGRVRNCVSMNGFGCINVGDSLKFEDCQGPAGTLCTTPSWDVSGVSGARQYLFIGHSNTSRSGAAKFTAVDQLRFMFNQNEHSWWTGTGAYNGDTDALISVKDCLQPWIVGNTGNPFHNFFRAETSAEFSYSTATNHLTLVSGSTAGIVNGMAVSGTGIVPGTIVVGVDATTVVLNITPTSGGTSQVQFGHVVNTNGAAYSLLLDGNTNMPIVEYNDFAAGRVAHIGIAATVKNAYIGLNHYYGNINPTIADNGIGTMGVWRALEAFANGWTPSAKTPKARKTKDRIVHLQGAITPGTMGVTALTLPEGFRPETSLELVAIGSIAGAVALVRIVIGSNGALSVYAVGGAEGHTLVNLDGINFFAPLVA